MKYSLKTDKFKNDCSKTGLLKIGNFFSHISQTNVFRCTKWGMKFSFKVSEQKKNWEPKLNKRHLYLD